MWLAQNIPRPYLNVFPSKNLTAAFKLQGPNMVHMKANTQFLVSLKQSTSPLQKLVHVGLLCVNLQTISITCVSQKLSATSKTKYVISELKFSASVISETTDIEFCIVHILQQRLQESVRAEKIVCWNVFILTIHNNQKHNFRILLQQQLPRSIVEGSRMAGELLGVPVDPDMSVYLSVSRSPPPLLSALSL